MDFTLASNNPTIMGWNQLVTAFLGSGGTETTLKVRSFSVGITQTVDVPELVTGATDKITWSKGIINVGGSIEAPLTKTTGDILLTAADYACLGWKGKESNVINVKSSIHGGPYPCMIQTLTLTATEKEACSISAQLLGRAGAMINSSTDGTEKVGMTTPSGSADGMMPPADLALEQIIMFDRVQVGAGMNPADGDCENLIPVKLTLTIDNKLQQNYVLGCGSDSSLDAWSISAGQRTIHGSITFQSGTSGSTQFVRTAGVDLSSSGSLIKISDASHTLVDIKGNDFYCLWSAKPPTLGIDKVVVDLDFTLVARSPGLYSITKGGLLS